MGTCQGNRNIYTNPMQRSCTIFENRLRLYIRDWKMMVAAIRSYSQEDGNVPDNALYRIMAEMGLCSTYDDKTTHLKEIIKGYIKDRDCERNWLIYFMLFMCDGNEASKMEYLCWTLNGIDMTKATVAGPALQEVLSSLMQLSVVTIPAMDSIKDYKEEIGKEPMATAVLKWCPDSYKDTLTIDEVRSWGVKCHNFTPGEARAAMLKLVVPEPVPKPIESRTVTAPKDTTEKPKTEKTTA